MNRLVNSREIYWCNDDDRYVLVIRSNNVIVGLNYCQGDDYDYFMKEFSESDEDLTNFYNSIKNYLNGTTEIDRINQAIWAHFEYKNE
jgi:hypothetical protein